MPYSNASEFDPSILQRTYDLIKVICFDFEQEAQINRFLNQEVTEFCCLKPPAISIENYLQRAAKYLQFDPANFIYMYIYMDRFFKNSPTDFINDYNIHRLAITCLRLAHKILDDDLVEGHPTFSKIAGISSSELHSLEHTAFARINYRLYISESEYITVKKKLVDLARLLELSSNRALWVQLNTAEQEFLARMPAPASQSSLEVNESFDVDMEENSQAPSTLELFTELKQLAHGEVEPIKYDPTSQQWFYKKSDLKLDQTYSSEPADNPFWLKIKSFH